MIKPPYIKPCEKDAQKPAVADFICREYTKKGYTKKSRYEFLQKRPETKLDFTQYGIFYHHFCGYNPESCNCTGFCMRQRTDRN